MGPEKIVLVMLVVLLLFGAKRIPEIAGSLGKGIRQFKSSLDEVGGPVRDSLRDVADAAREAPAPPRPRTEPRMLASIDEETTREPKRLM